MLFKDMDKKHTLYTGKMHEYFNVLKNEQGLDKELWIILVKQFERAADRFDNGWRGEYWGKLMRGMSLVYSYLQDEKLYSQLEETVKNLLSVENGGRISTYALENELIGWDVWCRKYVLLGLEFFYGICKDQTLKQDVLKSIMRMADYLIERIGPNEKQKSVEQTSYSWGAANSFSLLQPIIRLYILTGEKRYFDFSEYLIESQSIGGENLFKIMAETPKNPTDFEIKKAYEVISCFEGLLDYYSVTKKQWTLTACRNFADAIINTELTVVGGCGLEGEYFNGSTKAQVIKTEVEKQETCVTVTVMKFLSEMYLKTGEQKYIDVIENMFFNAYLGAFNDKENQGYMARPIFYSYSPVYDNPRWTLMGGNRNITNYACYGCCVAIGAAGIGIVPSIGVVKNEDVIKINYYFDGEYKVGETAFSIRSDYPYESNAKITFSKVDDAKKLWLRKPSWAKDFKVIAGAKVLEETNEYILLGEITCNTEIVCQGESPMIVHCSKDFNPEVENLIAIQKGAIVYAIDSLDTDLSVKNDISLDNINAEFSKEKAVLTTNDGKKINLTEYKSLAKDYYKIRDISAWIKIK